MHASEKSNVAKTESNICHALNIATYKINMIEKAIGQKKRAQKNEETKQISEGKLYDDRLGPSCPKICGV